MTTQGKPGHTPGPWTTRGHDGWWCTKDEDSGKTATWGVGPEGREDPVAIVVHDGHYTNKEFEANARLIAAAPKLLAKLEKVSAWLEMFATAAEVAAKDTRFQTLADANKTDAKNYRAVIADIATALSAAKGDAR